MGHVGGRGGRWSEMGLWVRVCGLGECEMGKVERLGMSGGGVGVEGGWEGEQAGK